MAGNLGLAIDLAQVPAEGRMRDDVVLFSESAGRFIVTVDPSLRDLFEAGFKGQPCACVGQVTRQADMSVRGLSGADILRVDIASLKAAWKRPFGDLI
jgi:phosphoribosylformylglycinamidine (FGAM) synthase-like enzyme